MNAAKKPAPPEQAPDSQTERQAPEPQAQTSAEPARKGSHSPVHMLHDRLEAAFSRRNETRTTRIISMLLVVALSTWIAALILQAGA